MSDLLKAPLMSHPAPVSTRTVEEPIFAPSIPAGEQIHTVAKKHSKKQAIALRAFLLHAILSASVLLNGLLGVAGCANIRKEHYPQISSTKLPAIDNAALKRMYGNNSVTVFPNAAAPIFSRQARDGYYRIDSSGLHLTVPKGFQYAAFAIGVGPSLAMRFGDAPLADDALLVIKYGPTMIDTLGLMCVTQNTSLKEIRTPLANILKVTDLKISAAGTGSGHRQFIIPMKDLKAAPTDNSPITAIVFFYGGNVAKVHQDLIDTNDFPTARDYVLNPMYTARGAFQDFQYNQDGAEMTISNIKVIVPQPPTGISQEAKQENIVRAATALSKLMDDVQQLVPGKPITTPYTYNRAGSPFDELQHIEK